jgi:hypothetical protein
MMIGPFLVQQIDKAWTHLAIAITEGSDALEGRAT